MALQALVVERLPALEQVVQAADDERRHVHLVEHLDRRARLPIGPVVGEVAAGGAVQHRAELEAADARSVARQLRDRPHQVVRVAVERIGRRREARARHQAEPERDERRVQLAARVGDVAIAIGHRHDREDRLQPHRVLCGGEQLVETHVGGAEEAHLAVAPGLAGRPLDGLEAVALLAVVEGLPLALGAAGAAHVLDHHHVAALREVAVVAERGARVDQVLVVRSLLEHHRVAPRLVGTDHVGVEGHAVAHRDRHVLVGDGAELCRPVVRSPRGRAGGGRHEHPNRERGHGSDLPKHVSPCSSRALSRPASRGLGAED